MDSNNKYLSDGVFLLSFNEYCEFDKIIPAVKDWWWLRTGGSNLGGGAIAVKNSNDPFDTPGTCQRLMSSPHGGFRPALNFDVISREAVEAAKIDFIMLTETIAITRNCLKTCKFDGYLQGYGGSEIRTLCLEYADRFKVLQKETDAIQNCMGLETETDYPNTRNKRNDNER